ncbi:hypothetical protein TRVL_05241 [Trypanosoma vivax]|nr:hypothetical protein TRVL_05241 [Trypanosoma vivax]
MKAVTPEPKRLDGTSIQSPNNGMPNVAEQLLFPQEKKKKKNDERLLQSLETIYNGHNRFATSTTHCPRSVSFLNRCMVNSERTCTFVINSTNSSAQLNDERWIDVKYASHVVPNIAQ